MKIGPLELRLVEGKDCWCYEIYRKGLLYTYGFRKTENEARQEALEDAHFIIHFS